MKNIGDHLAAPVGTRPYGGGESQYLWYERQKNSMAVLCTRNAPRFVRNFSSSRWLCVNLVEVTCDRDVNPGVRVCSGKLGGSREKGVGMRSKTRRIYEKRVFLIKFWKPATKSVFRCRLFVICEMKVGGLVRFDSVLYAKTVEFELFTAWFLGIESLWSAAHL